MPNPLDCITPTDKACPTSPIFFHAVFSSDGPALIRDSAPVTRPTDAAVSTPADLSALSRPATGAVFFHAVFPNPPAGDLQTRARPAPSPYGLPEVSIDGGHPERAAQQLAQFGHELYNAHKKFDLATITNFRDVYLAGPMKAFSDLCHGNFSAIGDDLSTPLMNKLRSLKKLFASI